MRRAEVAGIINPTVDEQQLEREAEDMGGRLERAAQLTPSIDGRKIQRQLERAIPGGGILGTAADAVRGTGGGGDGGRQDGSAVPGGESTIQTAMLDKLDDIHDELEKIGASGGLGGSEGGDGGGGILASIGGGAIGRKAAGMLGGAAGGGGLFAGLGSSAASVLGAGALGTTATVGSLVGLEKTQQSQSRGSLPSQAIQAGQDAIRANPGGVTNLATLPGSIGAQLGRRLGDRAANGSASQMDGFGTGSPNLDKLGGKRPPRASLDEPEWLSELTDPLEEPQWLSDLNDPLKEPKWLSDLTDPLEEPRWLSDLTDPIGEPQWITDFTDPIEEPQWLSNLTGPIKVETPDWLEDLESSLKLDISFPQPKIDLATGSVQKEVEAAFDEFKSDVVDEAVSTVENKITPDSPLS